MVWSNLLINVRELQRLGVRTDSCSSHQQGSGEVALKTNYVLIDFENVQPKNLELLKGHGFKVLDYP